MLDGPVTPIHATPIIKSPIAKMLSLDCIASPQLMYHPLSSFDSMSPHCFMHLFWLQNFQPGFPAAY